MFQNVWGTIYLPKTFENREYPGMPTKKLIIDFERGGVFRRNKTKNKIQRTYKVKISAGVVNTRSMEEQKLYGPTCMKTKGERLRKRGHVTTIAGDM